MGHMVARASWRWDGYLQCPIAIAAEGSGGSMGHEVIYELCLDSTGYAGERTLGGLEILWCKSWRGDAAGLIRSRYVPPWKIIARVPVGHPELVDPVGGQVLSSIVRILIMPCDSTSTLSDGRYRRASFTHTSKTDVGGEGVPMVQFRFIAIDTLLDWMQSMRTVGVCVQREGVVARPLYVYSDIFHDYHTFTSDSTLNGGGACDKEVIGSRVPMGPASSNSIVTQIAFRRWGWRGEAIRPTYHSPANHSSARSMHRCFTLAQYASMGANRYSFPSANSPLYLEARGREFISHWHPLPSQRVQSKLLFHFVIRKPIRSARRSRVSAFPCIDPHSLAAPGECERQ
ncbi:hypothetical protein NMY22_g13624 [Coprinellus aureogranulatus]|nr:hypothetical protein NMY22_g13624 [Coprinellus aureogranulatus]